ncbi:hypothetical protein IFM89_009723 [Coptis chinensis]|uniref:DUF2828 domain-containing protein n=1 Tax=Coptis chinensis TaxID=261450 RepID=A0A835H9U0_9MAGN|nr:hypothetical protein IFM89_009723 [Coptis chinensis]
MHNNEIIIGRLLHDSVSQVFAEELTSDLKLLNSGEVSQISFVSKWCPSLYSFFDRYTLLCENIAKRVFPSETYQEYERVKEGHYDYEVRDRLQKEVLLPLRQVLELLEVYMSGHQWNAIPYNRVSSVAMRLYSNSFREHDQLRFSEFLGKVERGKANVSAEVLLPHEIIESLRCYGDGGKLKEENMVKRLFVLSDMEFDQASTNSWETDYEAIQRKFSENGLFYHRAFHDEEKPEKEEDKEYEDEWLRDPYCYEKNNDESSTDSDDEDDGDDGDDENEDNDEDEDEDED